jgi:protein SPT2
MVSRKQIGSNNGVASGRPKPLPSKARSSVPERKPLVSTERRASAPVEKKRASAAPMQRRAAPPVERRPIEKRPLAASTSKRPSGGPMERRVGPPLKNVQQASHRPPSSKMQTALSKQHLEPRKGLPDPNRGRLMQKLLMVSSKPQMSKHTRPISSHSVSQDDRPKKRPSRPFPDDDDEDVMALNMIRKMFNTSRYADAPDDDSDMEAGFDEIMAEEKRSAKIARKEDEEQLRLIEEEEQRERMRKKRKLSQH